jgi:hypothetical protein
MQQKSLPLNNESAIKKGTAPAWKGKCEIAIWENDKDLDGKPCEKHLNIKITGCAFKNWPINVK